LHLWHGDLHLVPPTLPLASSASAAMLGPAQPSSPRCHSPCPAPGFHPQQEQKPDGGTAPTRQTPYSMHCGLRLLAHIGAKRLPWFPASAGLPEGSPVHTKAGQLQCWPPCSPYHGTGMLGRL
jgi:hypothetical protein